MSIESTMGLKKIFIHEANNNGQMPDNGDGWSDLGDVYQDTCKLTDADPEETVHKSETSNKKIYQTGETVTTLELSLMDPDLTLLARYFGGTISGEAGHRTWTRPRKLPYLEWAIWLQPEEGLFVGCPVARIVPKFDINYTSKGICLVPMKIVYLSELKASEGMTDPTETTSI